MIEAYGAGQSELPAVKRKLGDGSGGDERDRPKAAPPIYFKAEITAATPRRIPARFSLTSKPLYRMTIVWLWGTHLHAFP
jgi:hypothetical protein